MSVLLKAKEVTKIYEKAQKPSLDNVSFSVENGEFISIMGASGSGKTTLLNVLSTIDTPTGGEIRINGTDLKKHKYPCELSGGQRQRASAIRAIIKQPSILFADEPTGALDSGSATELLNALSSANQELHTTILMVTHDAYAASFANRIFIFRDGHILRELCKGDSGRHEFYEAITAEIAKSDTTRTGGAQK